VERLVHDGASHALDDLAVGVREIRQARQRAFELLAADGL